MQGFAFFLQSITLVKAAFRHKIMNFFITNQTLLDSYVTQSITILANRKGCGTLVLVLILMSD